MQENNVITIKKQEHDSLDLNNDYTLPDYIVDVRKLVSSDAKIRLNNVYRTDNCFIFEGEVTYSVVVICEDNCIKNLIYSEDFTLNGHADNCDVSVHDCTLEATAVRLVSPRKLNCRSKVNIITQNNISENTNTLYCGTGMPEAEYTTEKLMTKCGFLAIFDEELQNQHASRDIELTSAGDEIANIVYCRVNIRVNDRKLTDGKIFLRGEAVSEILYENASGDYIKHYDRAPFSEVIENKNGSSVQLCEVVASDIKASVRNNSFGEMKIIELDYSYRVRCRCYAECNTKVLTDAYSTEYDLECTSNCVTAMRLNSMFSSSLSVNDSCALDELIDDDIVDIVDHSVSVLSVNVKPDPLNRRLVISGDIRFDIIYKAEGYSALTVTRPYKYEREYDGNSADIFCEHYVDAQAMSCVIDKGRLMLNAEIYFNVMIAEYIEYKYIQEAEFSQCISESHSPVIIYYPNQNDTLWEIAKKYKTTCKDILSANSLNSDSLDGIKVLLLPKKKQRSIYNAII